MKRGFAFRGSIAALVSVASIGCQCGGPVPPCEDLSISFETPTAGASVATTIDVVANVTSTSGQLELGSAQLFTKLSTDQDFGSPADGTIDGTRVTFAGVVLPAGENVLKVEVTKKDTKCPFSQNIVVTAADRIPRVTRVRFPQDTNRDGVLNASELPAGTAIQLAVAASNAAGTTIQLKQGTTAVSAPLTYSGAEVTVSASQLSVGQSGTFTLFAEVLRGGTPANTAAGNPEAVGTIRVNRVLPQCANATNALNGPADDAAPGTAGFQLRAVGTVAPSVVSTRFRVVGGAQSPLLTPASGSVSFDFTVPATGDATYPVELEASDVDGNRCTSVVQARVDLAAPTVRITAPANAATLTTTPVAMVLSTTGADDGSNAVAFRKLGTAARVQVDTAQIASDAASLDVPFGQDGAYELTAEVTDLAGNLGTATVNVTVTLGTCGVSLVQPTCGSTLFGRDLGANRTYTVISESPNCLGRATRILLDGQVRGTGIIDQNGRFSNSVPFPTAKSYLIRAEVDNTTGPPSATECSVTVDLSAVELTNPAPGQVTPINLFQDGQSSTPGAQRVLAFTASVPTNGRIDVCTTQAMDPVTSQTRSACADGAAGWYLLAASIPTTSPVLGFTFPEGAYSIKLVVVVGTTFNVSPQVDVIVDVTRPCVQTGSLRSDRDANSDGRLSAAEYAAAGSFLSFQLGCGDGSLAALASQGVLLRQIVNGTPGAPLGANVAFAGGRVNLTQVALTGERDYLFWLQLTDLAGNPTAYAGSSDPGYIPLRVDLDPPVCTITAPSSLVLGVVDVPGGNLSVSVSTAADVRTNGVSVTLAGPTSANRLLTPNQPSNEATTTFPVSGTNTWSLSATCRDEAGNSATASPKNLTIDLDSPICEVTAPATGQTFTTNQLPTTITVGGAEGRTVTITSSLQPSTPIATPAVDGGVAVGRFVYPIGTQTVTASVSDSAGNECAALSNIIVNSTACNLVVSGLYSGGGTNWLNRNNTTPIDGGTTATATISVTSSNCTNRQVVTLTPTTPPGSPTTAQTDTSGNVTFSGVTVAHGEVYQVSISNGALPPELTTIAFSVDLVAPVVGAPVLGGTSTLGSSLYFVAATGNDFVRRGVPGYFADVSSSAAGAQFSLDVPAIAGAVNGSMEVLFKGNPVQSDTVTADPQTISYASLTLPQNDLGALVIRVVDVAGNMTAAYTGTATIDVVAPGPFTGIPVTVGTPTRNGGVGLSWPAAYDDGVDSASADHLGYEVRWTTSSVPGNNQMSLEGDYWSSRVFKEPTDTPPGTLARTLALPPLNTYYIAVRAHDEVGNYSAFVPPTPRPNDWSEVTLADSNANSAFGQSLAIGDLNGDGTSDVIVGAPTFVVGGVGSAYVYYGGAGLASQTGCSVACQSLVPSAPGQFGWDISAAGNVGEPGVDLIVSQPRWNSSRGRVFLYLGNTAGANISTTPAVEFQGDTSNQRLGYSARIIRDIDNDQLDEVAIATPLWDAVNVDVTRQRVGRVYIFKGRSLANWQALGSPVTVAAADWVLEGPTPRFCSVANPANCGNWYGTLRTGFVSLGDVDGSGRNYFTVPMSVGWASRLQIWRGSTVSAATAPLPSTSALQTLSDTAFDSVAFSGFSAAAVGGVNFVDGTAPTSFDLLISYPNSSRLYLYPDLTVTGALGSPLTFVGTNTLGIALAGGDLNGDNQPDIVAGEGGLTPTGTWVLFRRVGRPPGEAFDTDLGTGPAFSSAVLRGTGLSALGASVEVGEVTGDSSRDVLAGDPANGVVRIWR